MTKKLTDSQKLDMLIDGVSSISKRVLALEETPEVKVSKGSVKGNTPDASDDDLLPYGSKGKVLEGLKVSEIKELIPKSDFMDKGFNLNYKDMIAFFKAHKLGGRPWITANEQIEYFILPLKKAYNISDAKWNKKIALMKGEIKTKLIDAEHQLKGEGKKWTEKRQKAQGYKIANLQNILKSVSVIKS